MNITMLLSVDYLFWGAAVPKEYYYTYYASAVLRWIFNFNDSVFVFSMLANIPCALYFAMGKRKRLAALGCWVFMSMIFIRVPAMRSIHIPFLGYMLLLNLFIDDPKNRKRIQFLDGDFAPPDVKFGAWFLIGLNYVSAAIAKISTVEWRSGQALFWLFQDVMPRQNSVSSFFGSQPELLTILTYSVLVIEGLGWCLMFQTKHRFVFVALSSAFHAGILLTFRMGGLSAGMLIYHVFLLSLNFEETGRPKTRLTKRGK